MVRNPSVGGPAKMEADLYHSSGAQQKDALILQKINELREVYCETFQTSAKCAAGFLLPDGQWHVFPAPDLPEPVAARFHHALTGAGLPRSAAVQAEALPQAAVPAITGKRGREPDHEDEDEEEEDDGQESGDDDDYSPSQSPATIGHPTPPPEGEPTMPTATTVRFDDPRSTEHFLRKRLNEVQQLCLKSLTKQWIKTIEPRKQSRYQYKEKHVDEPKRPPWWPANVRYKEPDHLHSHERVELSLTLFFIYQHDELVDKLERVPKDHAERGSACNGWTEMLRNSTRELQLVFDPQEKASEEKRIRRKEILRDIYDAAYILEEIHYDERDAEYSKSYKNPVPTRKGRAKKGANPNARKRIDRGFYHDPLVPGSTFAFQHGPGTLGSISPDRGIPMATHTLPLRRLEPAVSRNDFANIQPHTDRSNSYPPPGEGNAPPNPYPGTIFSPPSMVGGPMAMTRSSSGLQSSTVVGDLSPRTSSNPFGSPQSYSARPTTASPIQSSQWIVSNTNQMFDTYQYNPQFRPTSIPSTDFSFTATANTTYTVEDLTSSGQEMNYEMTCNNRDYHMMEEEPEHNPFFRPGPSFHQ